MKCDICGNINDIEIHHIVPSNHVRSNYGGVFSYYSPGRGCVRTLVMSGVYTIDELAKVHDMLLDEIVKLKR